MALVQTSRLFSTHATRYRMPSGIPVVQQGVTWEPLLWTAGAVSLALFIAKAIENTDPVRRCGICDRAGHDARNCSQDPAKRIRLRMVKTGRCSCCKSRFRRTEAHHYAGPSDRNKGREMCGTCHLVCGHGGNYQNMAVNPRYCRL